MKSWWGIFVKFFTRTGIWFKKYSVIIALILVGLFIFLAILLIWILTAGRFGKKETEQPPLPLKTLLDIKDSINETNMAAAIEIAATEQEGVQLRDELKDISKIKEAKKRRERLLALYERVNK